ncbi:MATE family efflux transporter [[Clostridium] fimetarium]|nr:MATE family efflux transporter [[Clostridium] fimetarium]
MGVEHSSRLFSKYKGLNMKDLTKGSINKVILQFALPILLGQFIQLLYGVTDTWIIGNILGDNALAAVGSVTPIGDMIIGFLVGLTNGFAIIASRYYGAKDHDGLNKSFGGSLLFGLITSILFTVLSVAFLPSILKVMNIAPEESAAGSAYIKVLIIGMTASMLYNVFASILRAIGDTIAPLIFLIISVFINIVLVYTFVGGMHRGIQGASEATVIAQLISAILCFIYIYRHYPILHLTKSSFSFQSGLAKQLCACGFSMGLMSSLVSLGTLILQTSINTFSTNTIIAHYAARKLTNIFMTPFGVLAMTMASFSSQNFGAGKYDRIRTGIKKSIFFSWIWCVIVIIISYTIVPFLIKAITSTNSEEVIHTGTLYLQVNTLLYFVTVVIVILRNSLQGIGDNFTPIISSAIELIGKFLTVVLLTPVLGYMGIIISEPIVWVLMVIPLIVMMRKSIVFQDFNELD